MSTALFALTAVHYLAACVLYAFFLARGSKELGRFSVLLAITAVLAHIGYIAADWAFENHPPAATIHDALAVGSLLVMVAYLLALLRYPITVLGAFIAPVTLLLFLGAGFGRSVGEVPTEVRDALLPVHVAVNVLGIVFFALAFAVAIAYVIQERQLRRKHLGGLFQRLPSLDVLDSFGFRLVTIGFPLLTLGIITGAIWAVRSEPDPIALTTAQGFAILAWLFFASVLLLRVAAGWRGRRAAIGTMLGFACAVAVLIGYVLQSAGGA
jgi:ABC-type uncharacterized transport system permease subunit